MALGIWLWFDGKMAIAALVALVHDILVTLGIYSLTGFQVSPDTVIAFLTILGYSLYDTIVVFDRVQENTRGLASTNRMTYSDVVNLSMNQVLARSINTSLVAILPILSILVIGAWVLGATALQDFGLALFVGLTTGAYSSIFIASPLLALLKEREPRYAEIRRRLATGAGAAGSRRITPAAAASGNLAGAVAVSSTSGSRRVAAPDRVESVAPAAGADASRAQAGVENGAGQPAPRGRRRAAGRGAPTGSGAAAGEPGSAAAGAAESTSAGAAESASAAAAESARRSRARRHSRVHVRRRSRVHRGTDLHRRTGADQPIGGCRPTWLATGREPASASPAVPAGQSGAARPAAPPRTGNRPPPRPRKKGKRR